MAIREVLLPAYASYAAALDRLYRGLGRASISCADASAGMEYYRRLSAKHTSVPLDPAEIHALGVAEVARIHAEMLAVADTAGFSGDLGAMRKSLQADPRFFLESAAALRERIEVLSKSIDRKIPLWFGTVPRVTYGVESIPLSLSSQYPPAYAQPAPADHASSGIHWITSLPERCPTWMHVPLALHEAWPGHLMHIALMEEMDFLPAFRHGTLQCLC